MKSPQTITGNEKNPTVGLGFKVQNILVVNGLKTAVAFSNPGLNGVAYPKNENDSRIKSRPYLGAELAISDININLSLHSSTSVGGAR